MTIKTYDVYYRPFSVGGSWRVRRTNAPDEVRARLRVRKEMSDLLIKHIEIKSCHFIKFNDFTP